MKANASKLSKTLMQEIEQRLRRGEYLWHVVEQYDLIKNDKLKIVQYLNNQAGNI